ncbi:glycine dehydrogenase [candidate division WOR_3 bacterium SM23_42]|uniref:Probable glycine dehydrogenase (decarboxylating) subunit 1 n=1 Tax=candidate division WOR_3 bacterium SM23_42 TaxID=1703779 RepID=A0A0S8FTI3_UNCW3|nr:MAG: glycine dehydrogenase [candidate division WOR_3 bacterium SM23_42]
MHYLPLTPQDEKEILARIGVSSFEELLNQIIPKDMQYQGEIEMPVGVSENEVRKILGDLAGKNFNIDEYLSFLGAGVYDHYIPAVIDSLISRSEFYTAYTPYQAEVSQGTLQTIFEYQSVICELTGMDVSNASMYDGGSALAEAVHMANTIKGKNKIVLADLMHPFYQKITKTYTHECGVEIVQCPTKNGVTDIDVLNGLVDNETSCVCIQQPNFYGFLEDMSEIEKIVHGKNALLIAVVDPISLGVIKPPGEYRADIVVGEGQPLGVPQGFGGPLLGIFASKKEFVRYMPGRIVGETTDVDGRRGFVLTLQTREQHIRREKATSNICTNEALLALSALIYLCTLGKQGIIDVGDLCLSKSHYLRDRLIELKGIRLAHGQEFFKEFLVETDKPAKEILDALLKQRIFGGVPLSMFDENLQNQFLIAVTEKRTKEELDLFADRLSRVL